jgi:hypothetical protein
MVLGLVQWLRLLYYLQVPPIHLHLHFLRLLRSPLPHREMYCLVQKMLGLGYQQIQQIQRIQKIQQYRCYRLHLRLLQV